MLYVLTSDSNNVSKKIFKECIQDGCQNYAICVNFWFKQCFQRKFSKKAYKMAFKIMLFTSASHNVSKKFFKECIQDGC